MSAQDLANAAIAAGFRGDGLVTAIAIGLAESGGDVGARHVNADGTVDRGPWQFNSFWHAEVSDACAFDYTCAAQAAYRVSNGGTDWHEWASWTKGTYAAQLGTAQALAAGVAGGSNLPTIPPINPAGAIIALIVLAAIVG